MATKNKKSLKSDNLIAATITILGIVTFINLFIWWNPSDPLNMISTSATSISFGLVPVAIFAAIAFQIMMVIDSFKRNKVIWMIFLIFGSSVISLLYFFLEKPKIIQNNIRVLSWIALVIFSLASLLYIIPSLRNDASTQVDYAPIVEFQGKLTYKDAENGPGIYKVTIEGVSDAVEVEVGPPEFCDQFATQLPDLKIGDNVSVSAIQNDSLGNYVSVCETDTYIKKL